MKTKNLFLICACLALFSCDTEDDPTNDNQPIAECSNGENRFFDVLATANINVFDQQNGSPNQGQVFTTLEIKQDRFESCVDGSFTLNGYTENIISFTNVTNSTVSFDYQITQNLSGNVRQYQGFVSNLPPNQTDVNNTGDNTFFNLNNSNIVVQVGTITYN
jgi:hypothetical protein